MNCVWDAYICLLPQWMRDTIHHYKDTLIETRMRLGLPPEIVTTHNIYSFNRVINEDDISFTINVASKYSPWASATVAGGFITTAGGHRVGICGNCVVTNGKISTIRFATSVSIRVAREFYGISQDLKDLSGSVLIIGQPGCGKTTLLRDLIRNISDHSMGNVCVVDEKCEIFPTFHNKFCFSVGKRTDVISGCAKGDGIDMVLRNMGPKIIAIDEITAQKDCMSLLQAGWCGVQILATAHAGCKSDLLSRPVYRPILSYKLFDNLVIMKENRTWTLERME